MIGWGTREYAIVYALFAAMSMSEKKKSRDRQRGNIHCPFEEVQLYLLHGITALLELAVIIL